MHLNSYDSKEFYKDKLKRLYKEARKYPQPVYKRDGRLVRIWKGNHPNNRYKCYKKIANRYVRRIMVVGNGGNFKKLYDYWWNVD